MIAFLNNDHRCTWAPAFPKCSTGVPSILTALPVGWVFMQNMETWWWFLCTCFQVHPETHNQHILVGAEEGIYTLNLNELHENAMDLLYPRRTVWMFVIKDVVMTLSGKTPSLFRHDLVRSRDGWIQAQWLFQVGLHSNSKQNHRFTLSVNAITKIPEKFVPKKYSMTSKVFNHSKPGQGIKTYWNNNYWIVSFNLRYLTRKGAANAQ